MCVDLGPEPAAAGSLIMSLMVDSQDVEFHGGSQDSPPTPQVFQQGARSESESDVSDESDESIRIVLRPKNRNVNPDDLMNSYLLKPFKSKKRCLSNAVGECQQQIFS